MITIIRITMPIKGSIQEGSAPKNAAGAVVSAAAGVVVWDTVVTAGGCVTVEVAWGVALAVTEGEVTVMYPGTRVVLCPPEFTAVRLTE